jgi:hypothetical protein
MDNKAKEMRQRLQVKMVKRETEKKKKTEYLEKKGKKHVDVILTTDEHHLHISEKPMSLNQMTILRRKTDPGYEPKAIAVPNEYGPMWFLMQRL